MYLFYIFVSKKNLLTYQKLLTLATSFLQHILNNSLKYPIPNNLMRTNKIPNYIIPTYPPTFTLRSYPNESPALSPAAPAPQPPIDPPPTGAAPLTTLCAGNDPVVPGSRTRVTACAEVGYCCVLRQVVCGLRWEIFKVLRC